MKKLLSLVMLLPGLAFAAPLPPVDPGADADTDFANRCAAAGVIKCAGFDRLDEFTVDPERTCADPNDICLIPRWAETTIDPTALTVDSGTKASGGGSLRFNLPQNQDTEDCCGKMTTYLGDEFGARNLSRFQGKNFVAIQFRQRFTKAFETGSSLADNAFKQAAINYTDKCGNLTIVTENSSGRGFPQLYSDCGFQHYKVNASDFGPYVSGQEHYLQQGDYLCSYGDQREGNLSSCATYKADQWITFYYEIEFGDEDTANSHVRAWIAYEGQPMRQFIDFPYAKYDFDRDNDPKSQSFRRISLLPYITSKSAAKPNEAASTWYDELIVSTQPIPAPNGSAPVAGPVDLVPPAPPVGLVVE